MQRQRAAMLVLLGCFAAGAMVLRPRDGSAATAAPTLTTGNRWMGVASCAAAGCHNANGPPGSKRSEYSTWAAHDRHARAFLVLHEKRSQQMVRRLYGPDAKPATQSTLCLKCHATGNGGEDAPAVSDRSWVGDGVGCESCHGAAERWLSEHNRWPEGFPIEEKKQLGFVDLKDPRMRAEVCVSCHVGTAEKDVNHDLIAAGHPRLDFEFAAALAIYPRHWQNPIDDAEAWEVGQLVSALSAIRLLAARADGQHPWPEYAEYGCFSCHHDLTGAEPLRTKQAPGTMPWGTWYLALTDDLVKSGKPLDELRQTMQQHLPDRRAVLSKAHSLAERLQDRLQQRQPMTEQRRREIMRQLAEHRGSLDWDGTCQLYLAMVALKPTKQQNKGPLGQELRKMGAELRGSFVPGFDSPRRFDERARPYVENHLRAIRGLVGAD